MRVMAAIEVVRDYDAIFDFHMRTVDFQACARGAGVKMRKKHRVVDMWSMRLKKGPEEQGAKEEFETVLASRSSGSERYVEWVRER